MKITLLVPNISTNCVGRAYILAKSLQDYCEVEIVGPDFGDGVWVPCRSENVRYKAIIFHNCLAYFANLRKILFIDSKTDVVYVIKPMLLSYGVALLLKFWYKIPVVLDIDDWQVGMAFWRAMQTPLSWFRVWHPFWVGWEFIFDFFTDLADDITVSGFFLRQRYKGHLIRHGRDATLFNPDNYDAEELKHFYGFGNIKIVMFLGTARPHKGVEELIDAAQYLSDLEFEILVVGANFEDPYIHYLQRQADNQVTFVGMQPFNEIPRWYAIADVVIIPQRKNFASIGQTPAKLFDAMAMAKPIVATNVADISVILADCGFIVPPCDALALASKIRFLLENPAMGQCMGRKARSKFISMYSLQSVQQELIGVFSRYRLGR